MKVEFNIYCQTAALDDNEKEIMDVVTDEESGETKEEKRMIAYSDKFAMEAGSFSKLIADLVTRFDIDEQQCAQEIADNLARRCSNGVRIKYLKGLEEQEQVDEGPIQEYVATWKPGRKADASVATQLKKRLKDVPPEKRADVEAKLKEMLDDLGI